MTDSMAIEVAYALPERQLIRTLTVPRGTTAHEAVSLSGIEGEFDELSLADSPKLGIFGKAIKGDQVLNPGERVEIYRALKVDPKEVRKRRAAEAKERRAEGEG
ncbi:RnfH family protein [Luminiphilus sp. nBUS_16]|uniref:RnfH family protein n=1 Tax=Luminiphilus sp. nBUS_16 TaxID=3395315 RepID=UPI003EB70205